jgi:hypothetical protein
MSAISSRPLIAQHSHDLAVTSSTQRLDGNLVVNPCQSEVATGRSGPTESLAARSSGVITVCCPVLQFKQVGIVNGVARLMNAIHADQGVAGAASLEHASTAQLVRALVPRVGGDLSDTRAPAVQLMAALLRVPVKTVRPESCCSSR